MLTMAGSIEKVLADARMLVSRLRDHDNTADTLISQTQCLNKRINAMKQYQDDLSELNELARHRPRSTLILSLVQENTRIRDLQNENRELQQMLEEHQSALELIMTKYREQILKLIVANKLDKTAQQQQQDEAMDTSEKIEKIAEMAAVMQRAAQMDEDVCTRQQELITQLKTENKTLRSLLKNSMLQLASLENMDQETQTSRDSDSEDGARTHFEKQDTIKKQPKTKSFIRRANEKAAGKKADKSADKKNESSDPKTNSPKSDSTESVVEKSCSPKLEQADSKSNKSSSPKPDKTESRVQKSPPKSDKTDAKITDKSQKADKTESKTDKSSSAKSEKTDSKPEKSSKTGKTDTKSDKSPSPKSDRAPKIDKSPKTEKSDAKKDKSKLDQKGEKASPKPNKSGNKGDKNLVKSDAGGENKADDAGKATLNDLDSSPANKKKV